MNMQAIDDLIRTRWQQGYRLERSPASTSAEALAWLWEWADETGYPTWRHVGDARYRRAAQHWLWIRWRHRAEIVDRGGQEPAPESAIERAVRIPSERPRREGQ